MAKKCVELKERTTLLKEDARGWMKKVKKRKKKRGWIKGW